MKNSHKSKKIEVIRFESEELQEINVGTFFSGSFDID
jgi:hypothetical protein